MTIIHFYPITRFLSAFNLPSLLRSASLCGVIFGLVFGGINLTQTAYAQNKVEPIEADVRTFNIPAGPLDVALDRFSRTAGVNLTYDAALISEIMTKGLVGRYSISTGLMVLLVGSGIEVIAQPGGGYALRKAPVTGNPATRGETVFPMMTVSATADSVKQGTAEEGYRVSNVSGVGLWDERSLRDTPYSMSIVTSDLIENINAQNMGQIFKMNPLTQEPTIHNFTGVPQVTIRGIPSSNPIYDGIPLAAATGSAVSVIEIDRVEILSGTSGFLYGGGRVGGAVNYVTKNSTDVPLRRLTFGNYGGTQFYGHADVGGKFDEQGRFGYRANLLYQGGDTAIGEPVNQKVANIVLDGQITDTLYVDVKYTYNDYRKEATQPEFILTERFSIDTSKRYSPKWASHDIESHKAYTSLRWDPNQHLTLRSAFFYQDTRIRANQISFNDEGNGTFGQWLSNTANSKSEDYGGYIYLDTRFSTFAIDHKLTLGYSSTIYDYSVPADYYTGQAGTNNLPLNELKNIPEPDWGLFGNEPLLPVWTDRYDNILIGDTITFNDQWSAMVGLNYATTASKMAGIYGDSNYEKSELTPTVSLLYKPIEEVTTYVSYMEALEKGTIVDSFYANRGTVFPPMVSKQYEIGAKYDINPNLLLSSALFRIEKPNQYSDSATPQPNLFQDGLQVHNGVEMVLTGKVTDNLTVMAGGTLMDISVEKAESPDLEGKRPINAASRMGKIYAEYAFPWIPGLSLTGGIYYTGEKYGDTANTDKIPSYTLYDIGARYSTRLYNKSLIVRLNVINLTGKDYWQNQYFLGVPRTIAFSASTMF